VINTFFKNEGKIKGKVIPVTGRGGPYICETSRLPHFLDNRLTDGDKVVSLTVKVCLIILYLREEYFHV
jgi:hypothetical protein